MTQNSAKIQTETISSSAFPKQRYHGSPTPGFDADHDSELVMGSVLGLRGWNQDALGRLIPVAYSSAPAFRPGVNVAKCDYLTPNGYTYTRSDGKTVQQKFNLKPSIRDHSMAKCSCGYYAYFDDSSTESRHGTIGGIIEGTGLAVIGDKGFRVEKAELKALIVRGSDKRHKSGFWSWLAKWVLPSNARLQKSRHFGKRTDLAANFAWFGTLLVVSSLLSVVSLVAAIITEVDDPSNFSGLWLVTAFSLFWVFFAVSWLNITEDYSMGNSSPYVGSTRGGPGEVKIYKKSVLNLGDPNDPLSIARLQKLYPDVPIYTSVSAARKDFTLTSVSDFTVPPLELPAPDNTDDFWTLRDDTY